MKKINLRNNHKKRNFKPLLFLLLVLSSFFIFNQLMNNIKIKNNKEYFDFFIDKSNNKTDYSFLINEGFKVFSKIDFKNPKSLSLIPETSFEKENKEIIKDEDNYIEENYNNITSFVSNPNKEKIKEPIVYIYNTHQLETYSGESSSIANINPNVMMASYLLSSNLNDNKINTIVEDTNVSEFMKISNIQSDQFYATTRLLIKNNQNKYDTLKYFIDIHRDSISKDISTIEIDGKNYARILFVLGTSTDSYQKNKKVLEEINGICNDLYPKLSRGIYERNIEGWKVAYNQDISPNVMLIELGGKENNLEEVLNTTIALSKILTTYIKGE